MHLLVRWMEKQCFFFNTHSYLHVWTSLGRWQLILGIWKLKQCFFGAHGAGSHPATPPWPVAYGPPWAEAKPQVVQLSSCPPAMLTLQNPRARARLRLNVKGFKMGENAP